jgi:hypothetical protein
MRRAERSGQPSHEMKPTKRRPGRSSRLGLAASMVTTLVLFAAADVALPSVHWVLFLGPLAPLSFAVALQWDDRAGVVATCIRNSAAVVMAAWPILAFGSVAREVTVPSIIWFICGVSAVASLLAVLSMVGRRCETTGGQRHAMRFGAR